MYHLLILHRLQTPSRLSFQLFLRSVCQQLENVLFLQSKSIYALLFQLFLRDTCINQLLLYSSDIVKLFLGIFLLLFLFLLCLSNPFLQCQ